MSADPHVGWYEYRGARFKIERYAAWGYFSYYVGEIQLPWMRGSLTALCHEAGWFAWTARAIIRKVKRTIDREFRSRERNGERTDTDAWAAELPGGLDPLPEPNRDYRVLA